MSSRPTAGDLARFHGATVDDLLPARLRLLFVGINPGLWTAAVNAHFARPGNRFWPALHRAGVTRELVDPSEGFGDEARAEVERSGVGITNLVPVATARADELTAEQLREGGERLRALVRALDPPVVAVLGVTAYRQAFRRREAQVGLQQEPFEGAELWVLPNPSGLNAHETVDSLARAYREVATAAGVPLAR